MYAFEGKVFGEQYILNLPTHYFYLISIGLKEVNYSYNNNSPSKSSMVSSIVYAPVSGFKYFVYIFNC